MNIRDLKENTLYKGAYVEGANDIFYCFSINKLFNDCYEITWLDKIGISKYAYNNPHDLPIIEIF